MGLFDHKYGGLLGHAKQRIFAFVTESNNKKEASRLDLLKASKEARSNESKAYYQQLLDDEARKNLITKMVIAFTVLAVAIIVYKLATK